MLKGDLVGARRAAEAYAGVFPGRFYLEHQENGIPLQKTANEGLVQLSRELGLPLVATGDCHYLERSDARAQECSLELDLKSRHFPRFTPPAGNTLEGELERLAAAGLERLWPRIAALAPEAQREEYRARLGEEIAMIREMGFCGYFLMVAEIVNWARERGIPVGPGRGSAAGSLAAYCLGITGIDPIPYNLLFERFLNPERVNLPDIDIDFCQERREEVIDHVVSLYGREKVAQIITFGHLSARSVIRDVGRVLGMPYAKVDAIAKLVPEELGITLEQALDKEPCLGALAREDEQVGQLVKTACRLEGLCRHSGCHAAGLVVAPGPVSDFAPLHRDPKSGAVMTSYDMATIEKTGLV